MRALSDSALLQRINKARRLAGRPPLKRLPQGTVGQPDDCVIARALAEVTHINVDGEFMTVDEAFLAIMERAFGTRRVDDNKLPTPRRVAMWIYSFDSGEKPHLIDPVTSPSPVEGELGFQSVLV